MVSGKSQLVTLLLLFLPSLSAFYQIKKELGRVSCATFGEQCTMEEESRLRVAAVDMLTRKHQDRVISIRHFLNSEIHMFNEFFTKQLRTMHMDLDLMFSNTYGAFYQNNIEILNDFFEKIRGFSISFAETSINTIVELFFDDLFHVLFQITNPFYSLTEEQYRCMKHYYKEIEAFDDTPQRITNQLSLPLKNWKHFLGSLESLQNILDGYLNITLKDECERGLTRMEACAKCRKIEEKPCAAYCVNIISGCTYQMLDSEEAWKSTIESVMKLANQLNTQQNLVSALYPIPVLISEAIMLFQEKKDYITNKVIGKCLLDKKDFGIESRKKRHSKFKVNYSSKSKQSRDHLILNQMFTTFNEKMEKIKIFFGNVPEQLCREENWASESDEKCWNGTAVGPYHFPAVDFAQQLKNPEYQGPEFLTFPGGYVEERLRLHWLHSRIIHILSGRSSTMKKTANPHVQVSHTMAQIDDEDYSNYDYEGSAKPFSSKHSVFIKQEYQPFFREEDDKIEVHIEPFSVKSSPWTIPHFSVLFFCFVNLF